MFPPKGHPLSGAVVVAHHCHGYTFVIETAVTPRECVPLVKFCRKIGPVGNVSDAMLTADASPLVSSMRITKWSHDEVASGGDENVTHDHLLSDTLDPHRPSHLGRSHTVSRWATKLTLIREKFRLEHTLQSLMHRHNAPETISFSTAL